MELLIDSMYPPPVAEQLRLRGHDVIAARGNPQLQDLLDDELLTLARDQQRVIVSENQRDFVLLDEEWRRNGWPHLGVILTTDYQFPRRRGAGIGRLVRALEAWLAEHPGEAQPDSQLWWL